MPDVLLPSLARFIVLLGALISVAPQRIIAQELALSSRAPRFYMTAKGQQTPVEVAVQQNALLRQVVSLNLEQPTVGRLLKEIERQTGLRFGYSRDVVPSDRVVRLRADTITIGAALLSILMDTGIDVLLSSGRQITLVERPGRPRHTSTGTLVGRVTNAKTSEGLAGAEVILERTDWRTTTGADGRFRLEAIDSGTHTLMVRRLGFAKWSQRVSIREKQEDTVAVSLEPVVPKLEELVTTATGMQRRRDLGNAITTIHADSVLQSAPIRNLTDLLENRVPGLTVQHTSGAPGDPSRLRLRGIGSVMRNNDPIVIVDGVRMYSTQSEIRSGNLTNQGCPTVRTTTFGATCPASSNAASRVAGDLPAPSPLDQIDPNIIEKIEVFKGPSAATLYGADAANGVFVITTKRGRPGPTRWNATIIHGRTVTPGEWPEGYYRWGRSPEQGGEAKICALIDLTCRPDSLVRFQALNDPDLTVLGRGHLTSLSLTASGGNQALTYSVTGSYGDETGLLRLPEFEVERFRTVYNREIPEWMRYPHHLENWSVASAVTARLGSTGDVALLTNLFRKDQQRTGLERNPEKLAGTYVDRVNGLYIRPNPFDAPGPGDAGLTSSLLQDYYTRTTASSVGFRTGLNGNWRPRSWFTATGQAGLDFSPREDERFLPFGLPTPTDSGVLIRGVGRSLVSTFNLQGNLRRPLRWGFVFETNIGANLTTTKTADLVTSGANLVPGTSTLLGAQYLSATEGQTNTSVFGWYIEPRLAGRRLSLSTGFRLDGGSAYGARVTRTGGGGNLLGLPKLNGSWVISEEPFFPFKALFSSLRLRGAYGQAQVQPGPRDRLRLYAGRADDRLRLTSVGNTELRPERSVELEGGFDADLLDSRVSVELTAYQKTQVDALMPVQLPSSVNGGGSIVQNIGNIRNRGLEIRLTVKPVQSSLVTWNADLIYARNTNTLVKLGRGVLPNKVQGLVEGYPVGGRWAKPIYGYTDEDGNGILEFEEIRVGDSLVFMGRVQPDYTTALFTNLGLFGGRIQVTAGFSYAAGATQIDETARTNWVLVRALVDSTTPFSEQAAVLASVARPFVPLGNTDYGLIQDISTFRFTSLSVNYRAPDHVARLLRAQQLTVAVQGSNLGLRSTYRGKDPNVNSWSPGEGIRDTGQLPQPRTWQLRFSLAY